MENSKILTADEIIDKYDKEFEKSGSPYWLKKPMIEFAKQHVEKALKNCLEKYHHSIEENYDFGSSEIMNAYDLNNIK